MASVVISEKLRDDLLLVINDLACYELDSSGETTPGVPILTGRLLELSSLKAKLNTAPDQRG